MNKKLIGTAIVMTLTSGVSFNASATLASNAVLQFANGVTQCLGGYDIYGTCSSGYSVTSGSYFAIDGNGDQRFTNTEKTAMTRVVGVMINAAQPAYINPYGDPYVPSFGSIDEPFSFYYTEGRHQTTSPVYILADNGAGQVTLDFSGWDMYWNGGNILGSDVPTRTPDYANLICGLDCSYGDTFTLDYVVQIPSGNFTGVYYGLHLEGVISAVPVPAAAWLFGSGLIGLLGLAQRHK